MGFLCSVCGEDPQGVIERQRALETAARERLADAQAQVRTAQTELEEAMEHRVSIQERARCIRDMYTKNQLLGRENERPKNNQ